jgi:hypothetical protein
MRLLHLQRHNNKQHGCLWAGMLAVCGEFHLVCIVFIWWLMHCSVHVHVCRSWARLEQVSCLYVKRMCTGALAVPMCAADTSLTD